MVSIGDYVILGVEHEDLRVYDMSDPASPVLVSTMDASGRVYLDGTTLYATLVNAPSGVRVFDVSDPANPVFITEMDPVVTSFILSIEFANGLAYMIDYGDRNLLIYDLSDPTSPQFVSATALKFPRHLAVDGTDVYVGGFGLDIIDASDPTSPQVVGSLPIGTVGTPVSIQIRDDIAYMADDGGSGFTTVDVSDITNPVVLDTQFYLSGAGTFNIATTIVLDGDIAYASEMYETFSGKDVYYEKFFGIIDVSDPSHLARVELTQVDAWLGTGAICVRDGLAFVAGRNDLMVIDVTDHCVCAGDLTGDGELDFFDVSAFLDAFANQDSVADFTDDGEYDFFDVSAFLDHFAAGCP